MAKKSKKAKKKVGLTYIGKLWILFGVVVCGIVMLFVGICENKIGTMPSLEELENPKTNLATQIISSDGKLLGTYYIENRSNVSYSQISPNLINALVSIEDERFYKHSGIDEIALFRVAYGVLTLNKRGGGSTITQQLAKNMFPRDENLSVPQLVLRKLQEWVMAVVLERNYSKEEIITMYLNTVAYGHNTFGIKSASETFFNCEPSELTVEQAALMAGTVNAPTRYSPVRNPARALARRNLVIDKMLDNNYITQAEHDSIIQIPIDMSKFGVLDHSTGTATYFREFLRGELTRWAKTHRKADGTTYNIYKDGLKVYTTIDSRMQNYAEEAVREHLANTLQPMFYKHWQGEPMAPFVLPNQDEVDKLMTLSMRRSEKYRVLKKEGLSEDSIRSRFDVPSKMRVFSWDGPIDTVLSSWDSMLYYKHILQSSLMSVETGTGHVKAYVGGNDYRFFQYDHVTQAKRQVGSTFKPFLYTLAMQEGEFTPCTKIPHISYSIKLPDGTYWEPRNSGAVKVGEEVTLKWALAHSDNWVSTYLMKRFGPEAVIQMARRMGVTSHIEAVPAICLGVSDLSLYEMVGAMSTFANSGVFIKPIFITKIVDKNGNIIESFEPEHTEAFNEVTCHKMIELMKGVVQEGTGRRLRWVYGFKNPIAGKTGTTQNQSDGWFMGITPDLTTGVWTGAEDRSVHFRTISLGQGSNTALPIWGLYMQKIYADTSIKISKGDFNKPLVDISREFDCEAMDSETDFDSEEDEF